MCYFIKIAAVLFFLPLHCDSAAFLVQKESLFPHPLESELACDLLWSKECGKRVSQFFTLEKSVCCGFVIYGLYYAEIYSFSMFTFWRIFFITNGC